MRFSSDTSLPLLALSTAVRVRAWEYKYIPHLIDNFESVGCNTSDLARDATFVTLSGSPDLTPPSAKLVVSPRIGGDTAVLYVRSEDKEKATPTALNARVKALLPQSSPELRVRVWVWRTTTRGRIMFSENTRLICLNEKVPVLRPLPGHSRAPPALSGGGHSPAAARQPPAAGSWAAAAQHGVKRLPVTNTLDHRPKKKSNDTASQPSSSSLKPPASQMQSSGQPNPSRQPADSARSEAAIPKHVQDRLDAMEQLMAQVRADHAASMDSVTHSMHGYMQGFAEQMEGLRNMVHVLTQHMMTLSQWSLPVQAEHATSHSSSAALRPPCADEPSPLPWPHAVPDDGSDAAAGRPTDGRSACVCFGTLSSRALRSWHDATTAHDSVSALSTRTAAAAQSTNDWFPRCRPDV